MRRPRHPLIVLLCALCLLGAQQAAYAHLLSHFGFGAHLAATAATDDSDAGHGAATTLSHVCTTCAAFSALDTPPLLAAPRFSAAAGDAAALPRPTAHRLTATPAPPYGARAPPFVL